MTFALAGSLTLYGARKSAPIAVPISMIVTIVATIATGERRKS